MYNHLGNRCETISSREKIIARASLPRPRKLRFRFTPLLCQGIVTPYVVRTSAIRGPITARGFTFLRESARPSATDDSRKSSSINKIARNTVRRSTRRERPFLCSPRDPSSCFHENYDTPHWRTRVIYHGETADPRSTDSSVCVARESNQNIRAIGFAILHDDGIERANDNNRRYRSPIPSIYDSEYLCYARDL